MVVDSAEGTGDRFADAGVGGGHGGEDGRCVELLIGVCVGWISVEVENLSCF